MELVTGVPPKVIVGEPENTSVPVAVMVGIVTPVTGWLYFILKYFSVSCLSGSDKVVLNMITSGM